MPPADVLFAPRQTSTGLFVQVHEAGHPVAEIIRVRDAYRLACRMFNGRYRKTERPFICHAVGAASATSHFGGSTDLAIGAMFHAAYDSGQFPDGRNGGATEAHRVWLRARIGAAAEEIAARYAGFTFDTGDPEKILAAERDSPDDDLLFIALAHEVDDLMDGGLRFSPKYGEGIEGRVAACAALAMRIGNAALAETIRAHGRLYPAFAWIDDLGEKRLRGYRVAPSARAYLRLRRAARRKPGSVEIH
jgi:hypothetical protein